MDDQDVGGESQSAVKFKFIVKVFPMNFLDHILKSVGQCRIQKKFFCRLIGICRDQFPVD